MEKVLKLKRDANTGSDFLEEVMKSLDEKPSFTFWMTLAKAFETQSKEAARCEFPQRALNARLTDSLLLATAGPQYRLPPTTALVSRLLLQDRGAHRYSLYPRASIHRSGTCTSFRLDIREFVPQQVNHKDE